MEYVQSPMACMITAASAEVGTKKNIEVILYRAMTTTNAVTTPETGVREPALELIAVLEKDPVAAYAPTIGPRTLTTPMAMNSEFGLMV